MVPKPVIATLLLFPLTEAAEAAKNAEVRTKLCYPPASSHNCCQAIDCNMNVDASSMPHSSRVNFRRTH